MSSELLTCVLLMLSVNQYYILEDSDTIPSGFCVLNTVIFEVFPARKRNNLKYWLGLSDISDFAANLFVTDKNNLGMYEWYK